MRIKLWIVLVMSLVLRVGAQSRSNVQSCTVSPPNIQYRDTPARTNEMVEISCSVDSVFDFCQFSHINPLDVGQTSYQSNDAGIHCNIAGGDQSSKTCAQDSRITLMAQSGTNCGVRINSPSPEDTGMWKVTVGEIGSSNVQSNYKNVEIFTYNQSEVYLQEKRTEEDVSGTFEAWYNWDSNREDWRSGESGYQTIEWSCLAKYGSPAPTFVWTINGDDRNELHNENLFNIRDNSDITYDQGGYIKDMVSEMRFDVNDEFMDYLYNTHGIDPNPENGEINFDLECNVEQGASGEYNSESIRTRFNVKRVYFRDSMRAGTIGMIVGLVLAGLILIIVVMLLVFAKATERWCFADGEYGYQDPRDQKRRPPSQSQR